jgi:hypothetical protein
MNKINKINLTDFMNNSSLLTDEDFILVPKDKIGDLKNFEAEFQTINEEELTDFLDTTEGKNYIEMHKYDLEDVLVNMQSKNINGIEEYLDAIDFYIENDAFKFV